MTIGASPITPLEKEVYEALRGVIDPEIGENIVDLGLVYGAKASANAVSVRMTMTSQACPMGEMLLDDVYAVLTRALGEETEIEIHLVWDPPWNPDMISDEAKRRLGWERL